MVAIESVALDTASPKVAMLVDRGHGMNQSGADAALRSALTAFVDTLAPQHEIGIITIAPQVLRREDFTTSREDLKDAISGIFTEHETAAKLMDGMFETWDRRFEDDDLFPVFVLVVAEGADDSSYFSQDEYFEFLTDLLRRNGTIHAVALSRGLSIPGSALPQLSQHMAENTGGSYQFINQVTGLSGALTEVAEQINDHAAQIAARYQILFEAPEQQSQVSVRLSRAGLSLQLFADRRLPPSPD